MIKHYCMRLFEKRLGNPLSFVCLLSGEHPTHIPGMLRTSLLPLRRW